MAPLSSGHYCPNCKCGGCVIHRDNVRVQTLAHQQHSEFMQSLSEHEARQLLNTRPGGVFEYPFRKSKQEMRRDLDMAQQKPYVDTPVPAVQKDQRSWLEHNFLYIIGGLAVIGLIGELTVWAT